MSAIGLDALMGSFPEPETPPADPKPSAQDPPQGDPPADPAKKPDDPPPAGDDPPPADPAKKDPPPADPANPEDVFAGKGHNKAFAEMRIANTKYLGLFTRLGNAIGIQGAQEPEQIVEAIAAKIRELEAKQVNVPPEFLERVERGEQAMQELRQNQLREQAALGFQKVKTEFKLNDEELVAFANQLNDAQINPFTMEVNLMDEYRRLNFDTIVQKRIEEALAKEAARQDKVDGHSSTPPATKGAGGGTETKINTVAGMKNFLAKFPG